MIDDESPYAVEPRPAYANLADLLTRRAGLDPDREAVGQPRPERRGLTWSELDARVTAVAGGLARRGLVAGHRVGLVGPNSLELVVGYLAVVRAGFVAVPLHPDLEPAELSAALRDCGVAVALAADEVSDLDVTTLPLTEAGLAALADTGGAPVDSPPDPEALAALVHTAGSTGEPRPVMLSHRALLAHTEQAEVLGFGAETTVLAMLPLSGVFGLNAVLGGWLRSGARLVVLDGFDGFFDVVPGEQVTHLPTAPGLLARILRDVRCATHLTSLTTVVCGAAALPEGLREEFAARTRLRVDQGYGLTEAAPGVSTTLGGRLLGHGHVGRPLPGVEVRIGDGGDADEPGEIAIRGTNLFSGYWPDGAGGPDADGWFATGDVGHLRDGELFLLDRVRERITINGFPVYPAEVEEAILELPGVSSVAVLGRPDARTGAQVVAFVTGPAITAEAVEAHCAGRLAKFKRPAAVTVVDALPRGATGQVRKGRLRETPDAEVDA